MLPITESLRAAAVLLFAIALAGTVPLPALVTMGQGLGAVPALGALYGAALIGAFSLMSAAGGLAARLGGHTALLLAAGLSFVALVVMMVFPRFEVLVATQAAQAAALALAMQAYRVYRARLVPEQPGYRRVAILALGGSAAGLVLTAVAWSGHLSPWSYWLESILLGLSLALFTRAAPAARDAAAPIWQRPAWPGLRRHLVSIALAGAAGLMALLIPWQMERANGSYLMALPLALWLMVVALAIASPHGRLWALADRARALLAAAGYGLLTLGTWLIALELTLLAALLLGLAMGALSRHSVATTPAMDAAAVVALVGPGTLAALQASIGGITLTLLVYTALAMAAFVLQQRRTPDRDAVDAA